MQHRAKRSKKRHVSSEWRKSCHAFALHAWKSMDNTRDTSSNAVLKGRSLHNHHLTILKGLKQLMILLKKKKKEKKDMTSLSKKRFWIPVVPLLVQGHLRSKHP